MPQVLPLYMEHSRRYRSLLLLALFAVLSPMGYNVIIDKYKFVSLDFIGSTSAGGGSNMVTVTNKKEIINNQLMSTIMDQKSDTTNKKEIINNQITSTIIDNINNKGKKKKKKKGKAATTIISVDDSDSYRRSTFYYPPFFIFGHSTGHSGSTTFHKTLGEPGCPWNPVSHFEDKYKDKFLDEKKWPDDSKCELTNSKLIPHLLSRIKRTVDEFDQDRLIRYQYQKERQQDYSMNHTTYIDMGHFHNRGRVLECLAKYFGESAAFVRVRRNRYDIARSFVGTTSKSRTPCIIDNKMYKLEKRKNKKRKQTHGAHPEMATCPRSGENSGPVNLKVTDDIWDSFVPFQRFLWYADEMEHRWHTITKIAYDEESYNTGDIKATQSRKQQGWGRPRFYDVSWNSGEELGKEVDKLRKQLGCTSLPKVANPKTHVLHKERNLNCSEQILQDLEYRKLMKYDSKTLEILVSSKFPQHVDSKECEETRIQLEQATQTFTTGITFDESEWVLPAVDATFA